MIHYLYPARAQRGLAPRDTALCRGPGARTKDINHVTCDACLRAMGTPEYIRAARLNRL